MGIHVDLMLGIRESFGSLGPCVLRLEEDGELIQSAQIELGYSHRGIEKCCQSVNYITANLFAEKVDYLAAPACNLAYALAVEKLSVIDVPACAQYIRVLLLELNRISNHLFYAAQVALSVGSMTGFHFCLREREKYSDIFEMYCGSRVPFNSIRIGGVSDIVTEGLLYKIERALKETEAFIDELNHLLTLNPVFQQRMKNLAILNDTTIQEFGITGPNARCAGIKDDLRKKNPYVAYGKLSLEPIVVDAKKCDGFDRFLYRIREIMQSKSIIESVSRSIPSGNHNISVGPEFCPPAGDVYVEVEGPRGVFGVFLVSDGCPIPRRVKFVTPSIYSLRLLPALLRETMLEDAELVMKGLDISVSEADR